MKSLLDLFDQNDGKPFKARKIKSFSLPGVIELPVGTVVQVMERAAPRGADHVLGVILAEDGQEIRKQLYAGSQVWERV